MTPKPKPEPILQNSIEITNADNVWTARIVRVVSRDSISAPYKITAPSQTALFECIRVIFSLRRETV